MDLPCQTSAPVVNGKLIDVYDDLEAVKAVVLNELDNESNDVVVVTHSYGCIPGLSALAGLSPEARSAAGRKTAVRGAAVLAGFLIPTGARFIDLMPNGQLPPQYLLENNLTLPFAGPGAIHILYQDIPLVEQQKAIMRMKTQSHGVNICPMPDMVAGFQGIPVSLLVCKNDNAVAPEAYAGTVEGLKATDYAGHIEYADSGHSPFIGMPVPTAKFVRKAAGEDIVTGFASS